MAQNRLADLLARHRVAGTLAPSRAALVTHPDQGPDAGVEDWRHHDPDYDREAGLSYDPTQHGGFPLAWLTEPGPGGGLPVGWDRLLQLLRDTWTRERPASGWSAAQFTFGGAGEAPRRIAPFNPRRRAVLIVVTLGTIVVAPREGDIPNMANGLPLTAPAGASLSFTLATTAPVWARAEATATVTAVQLYDDDDDQAANVVARPAASP